MRVQAYLTAAAINLKRLAAAILGAISMIFIRAFLIASRNQKFRCPAHGGQRFLNRPRVQFLRNALAYVPRRIDDDRRQELRWFYDRRDLAEMRQALARCLAKWQAKCLKPTEWVEKNIKETLTCYRLPLAHHKHMKSTDEVDKRFVACGAASEL